MKSMPIFLVVLSILSGGLAQASDFKKAVVCAPVASMWIEPYEQHPEKKHPLPFMGDAGDTNNLDTQLLYGDPVYIVDTSKESDGWLKVESLGQVFCDRNTKLWQHVTDWVRVDTVKRVDTFPVYDLAVTSQWASVFKHKDLRDALPLFLSIGTKLEGIALKDDVWQVRLVDGSDGFISSSAVSRVAKEIKDIGIDALKEMFVNRAKTFEGGPYCWGGCCAWVGKMPAGGASDLLPISSVDCSALLYLICQSLGLRISRNSHDQYLTAKPLDPSKDGLKKGDLIFIKSPRSNFTRVNHPMIYLGLNGDGKDCFLEATGADHLKNKATHIITLEERFGIKDLSFKDMKLDAETKGYRFQDKYEFCFGTFFDSVEHIQQLRDNWFDSRCSL